jgi:hypothetical protein
MISQESVAYDAAERLPCSEFRVNKNIHDQTKLQKSSQGTAEENESETKTIFCSGLQYFNVFCHRSRLAGV